MIRIKDIQVKCLCGEWFKSPISFASLESFKSSHLSGNQAQCPHCGVVKFSESARSCYFLLTLLSCNLFRARAISTRWLKITVT